jgi:hypothetical protein
MKRATPRRQQLTESERDWLLDGPKLDRLLHLNFRRAERLWSANRDWALAEFSRKWPGYRPWAWWRYESPEPRRRLGGTGSALFDYRDYWPRANWQYGVPSMWATDKVADMFRESAIRHGDDGARWRRYDPADPPKFESQPSYLRRLNLLLPGELKRLIAEDFEPEIVPPPRVPTKPAPPPPPRGTPLRSVED